MSEVLLCFLAYERFCRNRSDFRSKGWWEHRVETAHSAARIMVASRVKAMRDGLAAWRVKTAERKQADIIPLNQRRVGNKMMKLRTIRRDVDQLSSQVVSVMNDNKQYALSLPGTPSTYWVEQRRKALEAKAAGGLLRESEREILKRQAEADALLLDARVAADTMRDWCGSIHRWY